MVAVNRLQLLANQVVSHCRDMQPLRQAHSPNLDARCHHLFYFDIEKYALKEKKIGKFRQISIKFKFIFRFDGDIPWLPNGRSVPFSGVRFAVALLFPMAAVAAVCGGIISIIAFNAPMRGNVTFFNIGKLFFAAYF